MNAAAAERQGQGMLQVCQAQRREHLLRVVRALASTCRRFAGLCSCRPWLGFGLFAGLLYELPWPC